MNKIREALENAISCAEELYEIGHGSYKNIAVVTQVECKEALAALELDIDVEAVRKANYDLMMFNANIKQRKMVSAALEKLLTLYGGEE